MWVLLVHVELSLNCLSLEWLSDQIFRAILEIEALELEGTGYFSDRQPPVAENKANYYGNEGAVTCQSECQLLSASLVTVC
jgi:hypothetical protein